MRQEQQVALLQITPGAGVPLAKLHKIDGSIELRTPAGRIYFADTLVNLNEGSRSQHWIESQIFEPNVSVQVMAEIELLEQGNGHFSPDLYYAGQKIRIVEIK
jgi:hypothetical protein